MATSHSLPQLPMAPSVTELARLILARCGEPGYAPAGQLPTERRLAEEFGVTRTMIRNALAALEAEGRISREVGRGTFLRASAGGMLTEPGAPNVAEVGPADVMAARRLLEAQVVPLVVAWATQRDFDQMRRCVEGGGAADSFEEFERWDFALHHAIVAASRNQLVVAMYGHIERARKGEIWGNLKRRNDSPERRAAYQSDHVELVAALCARETDHAVRVMEAHLTRVQANLLDRRSARGE